MTQTKTIEELKTIWEANKEGFKNQELGKLQDFIKDIFESQQLFALKYGDLQNNNKKRKNEFTCETSKKGAGNRRADIIIFIDNDDIVIPVEVERYGNIKAGESQLLQYQTDWRKKYGILTDGNEWRLYYDRWYETFYLSDIFKKEKYFWQEWRKYIAPQNYYDMAFNLNKGQRKLFETERLNPCESQNRPFFFNDITTLLRSFRTKISELVPLFAKEERQAIETTYSYVIQFILYKVLIDNNYQKLKNNYEIFRQKVKKAIVDKKYDSIIKDIKNISEYIYKNIYEPFRQKQEAINKRLMEQLKRSPTFEDITSWLDIIMFIDRYNFSDIRNELFGFVYENYLKELYHNEKKGQYFTDPAVVNFMLDELGYTKHILAKMKGEKISIIDPSCGAGTFLYSAALAIKEAFDKGNADSSKKIEKLVNNNVFGLEIEEFPLFLAEMNILMQLLPVVVGANYNNVIAEKLKLFITKDSIAEFLDTPINSNNVEDKHMHRSLFDNFNKSNMPTYMRDRKDLVDMFKSLEGDLTNRSRFDFVIGNPPYIGYNECADFIFAKKIKDKNDNTISMGNVYGMNLNTVKGREKPYSPKPNLYAFFIALGLALLKDNGKICYIIPQTILTAGDLDVLRYHLARYTTIEKIITFEGNLFIGRGIKQAKPVPTSSLIFVVKKAPSKSNHLVKIINYMPYIDNGNTDFEAYLHSHNKENKIIPQDKLLNEIQNWNFIKQDDSLQLIRQQYEFNSLSIEEYRRKELSDYDEIVLDGNINIDNKKVMMTLGNNDAYLIPSLRMGHTAITSYRYFDKSHKIKKAQGSQAYTKIINSRYKILWRYNNPSGFFYADKKDVLPNFGIYSIGSDNKNEILYLLSLLRSSISKFILDLSLKIGNEKAFLLGMTAIKQYFRLPKITSRNMHIKNEIIKQTETMLDNEMTVINDLVELPNTAIQTFDQISVNGHELSLKADDKTFTSKIKTDNVKIVKKAIDAKYFSKSSFIPNGNIHIQELKFLPAIDYEKQAKIKKYIDDLVYTLYFNISILNPSFEKMANIHKIVLNHKFYSIVNIDT